MRIEIAERLRPFSHLPGTTFILPGSFLQIEIFPVLIRINGVSTANPHSLAEIDLDLIGPITDFTALQDLENGSLRIFGKSLNGYFRYSVRALEKLEGIIISVEKAPPKGLAFHCKGQWTSKEKNALHQNEKRFFGKNALEENLKPFSLNSIEKLSLGNHKLQDWELVQRRLAFNEIFPIWHRLGQLVPHLPFNQLSGTALLLNDCRQAIEANAPEKILLHFRELYLCGFKSILSPRLIDNDFQGIKYRGSDLFLDPKVQISPLVLITEGGKLIRSLFIKEHPQIIYVLPALPPEFHCGRILNLKCGNQGALTIEWTKKSLRCMAFSALENQTLTFSFSNHEKKCRLRNSYKDKGITYIPGSQLDIIAGQNYWFDNFQR